MRLSGPPPVTTAPKEAGVTPRGGAKPKLWDGDWPAKVVGLDGLPKLPDTQPAVVVVCTSAAQFEAELWAQDREATAGTIVVLLGRGTDPMLLHTAKGPVAGTATVHSFGTDPPRRTSLKASVKINDAACPSVPLGFARVTFSKLFNPDLFTKAAANPSRLPALVLPAPLLAKVVRTMGVVVYKEEVTCLVRTRVDVLPSLEVAQVPRGTFVREHCPKETRGTEAKGSKPRWISRQPDGRRHRC